MSLGAVNKAPGADCMHSNDVGPGMTKLSFTTHTACNKQQLQNALQETSAEQHWEGCLPACITYMSSAPHTACNKQCCCTAVRQKVREASPDLLDCGLDPDQQTLKHHWMLKLLSCASLKFDACESLL